MTATLTDSQTALFDIAAEDEPRNGVRAEPREFSSPEETAVASEKEDAPIAPEAAGHNENGYVEIDPAGFLDSYRPPAIDGDFRGKHIVTVEQFSRDDLRVLFEAATTLKKRIRSGDRGVVEIASGQVLALLFFEASTRTDMSFQAAMLRLGGEVVGASNGIQFSSIYKGEDLPDTVRAAGCYADVIALRHPEVGASYLAARYLDLLAEEDREAAGGDQRRRRSGGAPHPGVAGPVHHPRMQGDGGRDGCHHGGATSNTGAPYTPSPSSWPPTVRREPG